MPAAMIQGAPAYYWERDYDRITQALMGLNQMLDEREKEKERRKARDLMMLQNNPNMANGPAGKQFMEQYSDDPQAVMFVQSLADKAEQQRILEVGNSDYINGIMEAQKAAGERAAEFMLSGQTLQDTADTMNEVNMWLGQPPDPEMTPQAMMGADFRDRLAFQNSQEDPRWSALQGLQEPYRNAVAQNLYSKGNFPMPKILGVGMEGIDPKIATAATIPGISDADLATMYQQWAGLLASPGARLQAETTRLGWEKQKELSEAEEKARRERIEIEKNADIAVKTTPPGKAPETAEATTVKGAVASVAKDFENQWSQAMAEVRAMPTGDERNAALKSVPAPPPTSVKLAATRAFESVKMDPVNAAAKFEEMWMKALAKHGNDQAKASAELLGYFKAKFGK